MRPFLLYTAALALLGGCASSGVTLSRGTQVLKAETRDDSTREALPCTVLGRPTVRLSQGDRYGIVSGLGAGDVDCAPVSPPADTTFLELSLNGWQGALDDGQYFVGGFPGYESVRYTDSRPVLQGLSIALKVRPEVTGADALPRTAEAGFNPALAWGYQYRWNRYTVSKNAFGNNVSSLSATGGLFAGVSAVGLKSSNTRGPDLVDRGVPAASVGVFGLLGFDRIHVGVAVGIDHGFGDRAGDWLYQDEVWYGVSVGLDLVK